MKLTPEQAEAILKGAYISKYGEVVGKIMFDNMNDPKGECAYIPLNIALEAIRLAREDIKKEFESRECEHPFYAVHTRCNGEINHCLRCGKDL